MTRAVRVFFRQLTEAQRLRVLKQLGLIPEDLGGTVLTESTLHHFARHANQDLLRDAIIRELFLAGGSIMQVARQVQLEQADVEDSLRRCLNLWA